jgi:hypothetical protein
MSFICGFVCGLAASVGVGLFVYAQVMEETNKLLVERHKLQVQLEEIRNIVRRLCARNGIITSHFNLD